jgi:hypothetical protein
MGTEFRNLVHRDGTGEIQTYSEWSVWDCKAKQWSASTAVVLRNILLVANHPSPEERFCIGQIPVNETDARTLNPFKTEKEERPYQLDLASGSRTHGRFTFSVAPVGRDYYGEDWKRIIYGSIVHTGCKKLVYKTMKFVVTDDEHRDDLGELLDDPVNGKHWFTGDSHAKGSSALMLLLGLPLVEKPQEEGEGKDEFVEVHDLYKPVQFRATVFKEWVGKGTIAYNPALDGTGIDLAIPLSSMKGKKLALGNYSAKVLLGLVFEAEERRAKVG